MQKTKFIINQLLENLLELIQIINSDDFSAESIKKIFNMVICICVNVKVDPYIDILRRCFNAFEKCALSDHFQELLFQYTENPFDLKQMFDETDEYSKY